MRNASVNLPRGVFSLGALAPDAAIAICAALIVVACRLLILVVSHTRLRPLAVPSSKLSTVVAGHECTGNHERQSAC